MRVIANFLFLASITLLFFTHHALARLEHGASVEIQSRRNGHREEHRIQAVQRQDNAASTLQPTPSQHQPSRVGVASNRSLKLSVTGRPQTDREKAYQDAVREAREQLISRLRELKPDLHWEGPKGREIDRLISGNKTEDETMGPPVNATMYTTTLELEVTSRDQANLLRHVRLEEAGTRQLFLLKPLLAALAVLLTIAGYYRLEDMTKGYYTLLLRASAVVLLGVVGLGIFFWS